jgi:ubiquinol-cytochrome c reductase cytochrome b/c1 subunit
MSQARIMSAGGCHSAGRISMFRSRSFAQDAALFCVLFIVIDGCLALALNPPLRLMSTFYLALFVHIGFSIYLGTFTRVRTLTWVLLILAWIVGEFFGFAGYILPWGQLSFWLAASFPWLEPVSTSLSKMPVSADMGLILLFLLLGFDLMAAHLALWRTRGLLVFVSFAFVVFGAALSLRLLVSHSIPSAEHIDPAADLNPLTPPAIVPEWYVLPFYALLRAMPWKIGGVVIAFAAALVPLIWPWVGAQVFRVGWLGKIWCVLCVQLAAVWIGLGMLGASRLDDNVVVMTRLSAVFYFGFFLIVPFIMRSLSRREPAVT